ncbi:MAG TPA: branched-chain amino acid ABC transporter substrate-binding protein, partial [Aestuariivirga sp.]
MRIISNMSRRALLGVMGAAILAATPTTGFAENTKLKIGFVGVTSGPAAAWGTSNVRSMQTLAAWYNE